jgi:hypothetical protein
MKRFNSRKGFANIVATIAVMIVLAAGYTWWMQKSIFDIQTAASVPTRPSSGEQATIVSDTNTSAYIYGPELNKVKVSLVSNDEKTSIVPGDYCGGNEGDTEYGGHYKLILDPKTATWDSPGGNIGMKWGYSEVDLGELSFVKGGPWDKGFTVDALGPNSYKNFILLWQYAGCNGSLLSIFGYDFETGKLMRYKFASSGAAAQDSFFVSFIKKSKVGNLLTTSYNNATGKWTNIEWSLDPSVKVFRPIHSNDY